MIVGVVVAVVFVLILIGSVVGVRRNSPPPFHDPDLETDKARIHYQGNGNSGLGGGGSI